MGNERRANCEAHVDYQPLATDVGFIVRRHIFPGLRGGGGVKLFCRRILARLPPPPRPWFQKFWKLENCFPVFWFPVTTHPHPTPLPPNTNIWKGWLLISREEPFWQGSVRGERLIFYLKVALREWSKSLFSMLTCQSPPSLHLCDGGKSAGDCAQYIASNKQYLTHRLSHRQILTIFITSQMRTTTATPIENQKENSLDILCFILCIDIVPLQSTLVQVHADEQLLVGGETRPHPVTRAGTRATLPTGAAGSSVNQRLCCSQ